MKEQRSRGEERRDLYLPGASPPRLHPRRVEECPPPAGVGTPRRRKAADKKSRQFLSFNSIVQSLLRPANQSPGIVQRRGR